MSVFNMDKVWRSSDARINHRFLSFLSPFIPPAQQGRQSCKHVRHLWQEPSASWPDLTASEQIPPSLLAQKQLQNHSGSPEAATLYKGEEQFRRGGKQREREREKKKKNWLQIYLGQSVFSTAQRTVYQDQAGKAWAYATAGLIHRPWGRISSTVRLLSSKNTKNTQHIATTAWMVRS